MLDEKIHTRQQLQELQVLHAIALASVEARSTDELLCRVTKILSENLFYHHCGVLLWDKRTQTLRPHHSYHGISDEAKKAVIAPGEGISGEVALKQRSRRIADIRQETNYWMVSPDTHSELSVPLMVDHQLVGVLNVESPEVGAFTESDEQLLTTIAGQLATALERLRLLEETNQRYHQLSSINQTSLAITGILDTQEVLEQLASQIIDLLHPDTFMVAFYNQDSDLLEVTLVIENGKHLKEAENLVVPVEEGGLTGWIMHNRQSLLIENLNENQLPAKPKHTGKPAQSWVGVPIAAHNQLLGVISVQSFKPYAFSEEDRKFLESLANQVAIAIQNARLYENAHKRLERLAALREIDRAITSYNKLEKTLDVLLEKMTTQLDVDAAAILLLDKEQRTLKYAAGVGFRTSALQHTVLSQGESYAGRAAQKRMIVHIPELKKQRTAFNRSADFAAEGFDEYYAVPLVTKGEVIGVLEVFHRKPINPQNEWLQFMEALSAQAAIAIENSRLIFDLQESNRKLVRAYDATLEGWSRALELRDQDTQGHTKRVTQMTLRLARAMGIPENEMEHVRRGAMLHDIGKMAIPDNVLKKPSELDESENEVIREHPVKAYEMLSEIEYLQPALDIPRFHHEKWDGSGYPYGLKGEEIPLVARIFAVVDVWDALRSERPYRHAWSDAEIKAYIREQSNKHFDPQVVETFLKILEEDPPEIP